MTGGRGLIDLADPWLWVLWAAAIAVVVPLVDARARGAALVTFYLGGIWMLLGPQAVLLAVAVVLVVSLAARQLESATAERRPWLLAVAVGQVLALLVLHKLGDEWPATRSLAGVLAAVGFAYVALRAIDLLRAVADGRASAPGMLASASYLVPLHMLAAGPIQAFHEFANQPLVPPPLARRDVAEGLERIVRGLFKTYVLAGAFEKVCLTGFKAEGAYFWVELQLYYLWVYLDFSAYSDVAVGMGRLLGVATPENFDRPLTARNLTQLWERWHISLALFLRRNVFLPLQLAGARRFPGHQLGVASTALMVTFGFCGLWHDLSPIFALWGLYHGVGLAIVNLYRHLLNRYLGRDGVKRYLASRPIRWLATALTFEFVAVSLAIVFHPHLLRLIPLFR